MKNTKRLFSFALIVAMILASCFTLKVVKAEEEEVTKYNVTYNFGELADPITIQVEEGDYIPYPGDQGIPATIGDNAAYGVYADPNYSSYYNYDNGVWEDTTVYVLYEPYEYIVHDIDIEVTIPEVGTEITYEECENCFNGYDWGTATPQLEITVPEDANYETPQPYEDYNGDIETPIVNYWLAGFEGEDYDTPYLGTIEIGGDYYAEIVLYTKGDYIFASDANVKINGEDAIILYYDWEYISLGYLIHIPNVYEILDGEDQTITTDEELTVRASGEVSMFVGLQVDGEDVDEDNYTITEGSTIATLKASFLNTLDVGEHTLTFLYTDGEVSTTFTIVRPLIGASAKSLNPQTGDMIMYSIVTMLISAVGIASVSFKRRYNN